MVLFFFALLGGIVTYKASSQPWMNSVRASSAGTLVCYLMVLLLAGTDKANVYATMFFGGSFVGMTSSHRLNHTGILIASCVFGAISAVILPLLNGIGGALGVCAFISVVIVHLGSVAFQRIAMRK